MNPSNDIWVITDTHFGHDKMVELCGRPKNFTSLILENCEKLIHPNSTLIHLGDVTWGTMNELMSIKAKHKILVKGNHDKKSYSWYMANGFDFACETFTWLTGGLDIVFSHKPLIFHEHDVNIHGHLHSIATIESPCLHYPVAMEHKYEPIKLSDILPVIAKRATIKKGVN